MRLGPSTGGGRAGAVNGLMGELLEGHLREHILDSDERGRASALDEVVQVLRTYLK